MGQVANSGNCEMVDSMTITEQRNRRQKLDSLRRLCKDAIYRRKLILTVAVYWSYVVLGWVLSQAGTALPDLQRLVNIDLETASWIFTSWSIGFVVGSLISGFLYDRCNRLGIMLFSSAGMAVCTICLPYTGSFPLMIIVRVLTGIFSGGSDTGANTIVPSTWGTEARSYVQALYLSYSIGGIVSPLATKPFMSPKSTQMIIIAHGIGDKYDSPNGSEYEMGYSNDIFNTTSVESPQERTNIHYAFITTGLLCFSASASFIVMLFRGKFDMKEEADQPTKEENTLLGTDTKEQTNIVSSVVGKYVMLSCSTAISMLYNASEVSFGDFLVTFCLDYLEWDNSTSTLLVSMYWVSSCLGGICGVLIMRKCSPAPVLFVTFLIWNASFLAVVLASIWKIDVLIWIFVPISGFSMVFISPNVISWTGENVCEISGKVSSLFMISSGVGLAVNPTFIGYMMEQYSYIYFFFILLGESVICTMLFTVSYMRSRFSFRSKNTLKGTAESKDGGDV